MFPSPLSFHVNYLPLLMAEKFRGTPHSRRPCAPFWLLPWHASCSFFTFRFTLFIFLFLPPRPPPSTDNWRLCLQLFGQKSKPKRRRSQLPRGTLMARSRRIRSRPPPAASWRHLNVHICGCKAAAASAASAGVVQCVVQVFASTAYKTKTRLESVSKLHRGREREREGDRERENTHTAGRQSPLKPERDTQRRRGEGYVGGMLKVSWWKRQHCWGGFHVFSCTMHSTIYLHIRNLGTSMWFFRELHWGYPGIRWIEEYLMKMKGLLARSI